MIYNNKNVEVNYQSIDDKLNKEKLCEYNDRFVNLNQTKIIKNSFNYEFDNYLMGKELLKGEEDLEEFFDKIRKLIESEDYVPSF